MNDIKRLSLFFVAVCLSVPGCNHRPFEPGDTSRHDTGGGEAGTDVSDETMTDDERVDMGEQLRELMADLAERKRA